MLRLLLLVLSTGLLSIVLGPAVTEPVHPSPVYPETLPGAFTGGFGEETCHSCHFDYPLNPGIGSLAVEGVPGQYRPGKRYTFTIILKRKELGRAGFQLSSRFTDGSQAGEFSNNSERLRFTKALRTVRYLQHSSEGSTVNGNRAQWEVQWTAPSPGGGKIIINMAANAGNGDASAFGDYIYVREFRIAQADS